LLHPNPPSETTKKTNMEVGVHLFLSRSASY
jgi:hypothetical protein